MKIHKATDTNVTLCGIATPGKVMSTRWHQVDCNRCRAIGAQKQITNKPTNQQQELNLEVQNGES